MTSDLQSLKCDVNPENSNNLRNLIAQRESHNGTLPSLFNLSKIEFILFPCKMAIKPAMHSCNTDRWLPVQYRLPEPEPSLLLRATTQTALPTHSCS